jgi:putative endonuclease
MYYVYILHIKKTGRYYTGQTQNLAKRLQKHTRGETKSIKNRGEVELVYIERYSTRAEAMKREKQIKSFKGGMAFKRLLADQDKQKKSKLVLAEVPPLAG